MDRVISYMGFHIRAFAQGQDRWLAIVRGERRPLVTSSARGTANAAIDLALDAIDEDDMK